MDKDSAAPTAKKKSFLSLLTDVPHLIVELLRAELELLKAELVSKLKSAGIGIALFAVSLSLVLLALLLLVLAGVFALALVLPAWAALLSAGGAVLIVAAVFAGLGVGTMSSASSPKPSETIEGIRRDIRVVRGES